MPIADQKLAGSLAALRRLQQRGRRVFQSRQFKRVDRERLIKSGFLKEVTLGWLVSSSPSARDGDTTPWYASFWEFCGRYCDERFGKSWFLSPEQSLLLHAEHTAVPTQLIVCSPRGTNNKLVLPFGGSLFDLKQPRMPPPSALAVRDGLRIFSAGASLVRVSDALFRTHPVEAKVALASIRDASDVLSGLLEAGRSTVAGRLAGAFRHIHRGDIADEILRAMKTAGFDVRERNPFNSEESFTSPSGMEPPIVVRVRALWQAARSTVLDVFPDPPGLPADKDAYLRTIDEIYGADAYNSLSIEGYTVSAELIERVKAGNWNPDRVEQDREHRDALAARGYWQAFQQVKANVAKIISGANAGRLARTAHRDWYRELFQPCAAAGVVNLTMLAGYRNDAVYLRNSRHVPPRWEAVRDAMPALFDLLENEPSPAVRAVIGHWLLGYIHPYPDGNGRVARFLMNTMLASGGYPWTIIRLEDRDAYLNALEAASVSGEIRPFAKLVASATKRSMRRARTEASRLRATVE